MSHLHTNFSWPGMHNTVRKLIQECDVYQRCKIDTLQSAGLLQPLPIPNRIWIDISMDFVEGLPPSNCFIVIMVVVDRHSKYSHFIPLKHPFTALSVAKEFLNQIIRIHSISVSIVSDRD
ncbi:hypothetical protein ACOSQ3_004496 [Xanthoceras sorbifolium]